MKMPKWFIYIFVVVWAVACLLILSALIGGMVQAQTPQELPSPNSDLDSVIVRDNYGSTQTSEFLPCRRGSHWVSAIPWQVDGKRLEGHCELDGSLMAIVLGTRELSTQELKDAGRLYQCAAIEGLKAAVLAHDKGVPGGMSEATRDFLTVIKKDYDNLLCTGILERIGKLDALGVPWPDLTNHKLELAPGAVRVYPLDDDAPDFIPMLQNVPNSTCPTGYKWGGVVDTGNDRSGIQFWCMRIDIGKPRNGQPKTKPDLK